jgi:reactive intermediate/imine deaminase
VKPISIPGAIPPVGHYSTAILSHGFCFVSGILPIDPMTGKKYADASFEDQTAVVLDNLDRILQAAGTSLHKLVKVTVFVSDIRHWESFNKLYKVKLSDHKPVRTVVPTTTLHSGFLIEVDAIAEM